MGKLSTKPVYEAMLDADILILVGAYAHYDPCINHKIPAIQIDLEVARISHRHAST